MNKEEFTTELLKLNIKPTKEQMNQLDAFYKLLKDWNTKINLTRVISEEDVYLKHFYDSLTIVKEIDLNSVKTLCDVGTGAGFPGIVLKIFFPNLHIILIDSLQKRINYLNQVIKELNLKNIKAIHTRAEEYTGSFDIVTSRAVANIEKLVHYTMHLLKKDGLFIGMKGNIDKELTDEVKRKLEKNYNIIRINRFYLPKENSSRSLIVMNNK